MIAFVEQNTIWVQNDVSPEDLLPSNEKILLPVHRFVCAFLTDTSLAAASDTC
jgi:hypothetical protein